MSQVRVKAVNNDIEYGLFEDLVESYHLDSQIKDDFQRDLDCYIQSSKLTKDDHLIYAHTITNT